MSDYDSAAEERALRRILDEIERAITGSAGSAVETIRRYTDEDYLLTDPTGTVITKTEILEALRRGDAKVSSYSLSDLRIRVEPGWALVIGRASGEGVNPDGEVFRGDHRFTSTWTKTSDGWKIVAWQYTLIQNP
jgi:ketosteroid isomerase-like protein